MSQNFLSCSEKTKALNIFNEEGQLIYSMEALSTYNYCKGIILDTIYNRVYYLGVTEI